MERKKKFFPLQYLWEDYQGSGGKENEIPN